jgi:hypothetical protein
VQFDEGEFMKRYLTDSLPIQMVDQFNVRLAVVQSLLSSDVRCRIRGRDFIKIFTFTAADPIDPIGRGERSIAPEAGGWRFLKSRTAYRSQSHFLQTVGHSSCRLAVLLTSNHSLLTLHYPQPAPKKRLTIYT